MTRTTRVVVPNYFYHITQRGNYRQNIFQDDEDRLFSIIIVSQASCLWYLTLKPEA